MNGLLPTETLRRSRIIRRGASLADTEKSAEKSLTIIMGYDRCVTRLVKLTTVLLLAFALAAVPLVADWCAVSCEAAHGATADAVPACHHTTAAAPRISEIPTPCGHDHHPVVVDAATTTVVAPRAALTMAVPGIDALTSTEASVLNRATRVDAAIGSPPTVALATILRI